MKYRSKKLNKPRVRVLFNTGTRPHRNHKAYQRSKKIEV
jgi:hypothetical protein